MLNLLLAADIGSTILYVFIILGVVIAVSLIVYFIWELVLSYTKKNQNGEKTTRITRQDSNLETYTFEEKPKSAPKLLTNKYAEVDEAKAEEEKNAISESEEERLNRERREYLEKRRQELIRRLQEEEANNAQAEEEEEADEEEEPEEVQEVETDENEIEDEQEEVEDEAEEETEEAEPIEEVPELVPEEDENKQEEEIARLEAEKEELLKEKERYEQMCRELEEAKQQLLEAVQANENIPQETQVPVMSLDHLKARLADAEEKLKANEKELKQCKKDYVPLNKVWRTYEKDFKKLQRKEALVAKQQVVLYGVNNYADIDEEKAKKLAEDLDLLDGLKLSVQHCEEVMAKNEDRYPLLKRMYEVLKRQNTDLKDEIKYLQEQIAELEAQVEGE